MPHQRLSTFWYYPWMASSTSRFYHLGNVIAAHLYWFVSPLITHPSFLILSILPPLSSSISKPFHILTSSSSLSYLLAMTLCFHDEPNIFVHRYFHNLVVLLRLSLGSSLPELLLPTNCTVFGTYLCIPLSLAIASHPRSCSYLLPRRLLAPSYAILSSCPAGAVPTYSP